MGDIPKHAIAVEKVGGGPAYRLTHKQAAFCREFMIDLNATQAAIRAGYSPRTANEQGAQNLAKLSIRAEIKRRIDDRTKRVEVNADFVVRMLVENIQRSMQAIAVTDAEGNPIGQYRYSGAVVNRSLELLGRHLGMFKDVQEVEVRPTANMIAHLLAELEQTNNVIDADYIERVALNH